MAARQNNKMGTEPFAWESWCFLASVCKGASDVTVINHLLRLSTYTT